MRHEPAAYSWKHDRKRSIETYRRWADQAWFEAVAECPHDLSDPDYAIGFQDGFVDYVYAGGTTEPPPVPPRKYWNVMLRSPEGKQRADQWAAGYRHGAQVARDGGYRELGTIRSTLGAPPFESYETEIAAAPEFVPHSDDAGPEIWDSHELPLPSAGPDDPSASPFPEAAAPAPTESTSTAPERLPTAATPESLPDRAGIAIASPTPTDLGPELTVPGLRTGNDFSASGWVRRGQGAPSTFASRAGAAASISSDTAPAVPARAPEPRKATPSSPSAPTRKVKPIRPQAPLRFRGGESQTAPPSPAASSFRVLGESGRDQPETSATVVVHLEASPKSSSRASVQAVHVVDSPEVNDPLRVNSASTENESAASTIRVRSTPPASTRQPNGRARDRSPAFRR